RPNITPSQTIATLDIARKTKASPHLTVLLPAPVALPDAQRDRTRGRACCRASIASAWRVSVTSGVCSVYVWITGGGFVTATRCPEKGLKVGHRRPPLRLLAAPWIILRCSRQTNLKPLRCSPTQRTAALCRFCWTAAAALQRCAIWRIGAWLSQTACLCR